MIITKELLKAVVDNKIKLKNIEFIDEYTSAEKLENHIKRLEELSNELKIIACAPKNLKENNEKSI